MLKREVDTSLEKISWSSMVTLNKTLAMILVCAADDFRRYQKMQN